MLYVCRQNGLWTLAWYLWGCCKNAARYGVFHWNMHIETIAKTERNYCCDLQNRDKKRASWTIWHLIFSQDLCLITYPLACVQYLFEYVLKFSLFQAEFLFEAEMIKIKAPELKSKEVPFSHFWCSVMYKSKGFFKACLKNGFEFNLLYTSSSLLMVWDFLIVWISQSLMIQYIMQILLFTG